MTTLGYAILGLILLTELFELFLSRLNDRHAKAVAAAAPADAAAAYGGDVEQLRRAIEYATTRSKLGDIRGLAAMPVFYALFLTGALAGVFSAINTAFTSEYLRAIVFFAGWSALFWLIGLPFSIYGTFVVEKRYGFNRTTAKTYIRDTAVGGAVSLVILAVVVFGVIFFINAAGSLWWLYAAIFMIVLSLGITVIYPTLIAPLFNTFTPLEDGELKTRIEALAEKAGFPLTGIYTMDASRRTTHSNAYFTGLGRHKRIVLFDTLIMRHTEDEIVAVLAHEIGHYQMGHIRRMLVTSSTIILVAAFIAGLLVNRPEIYAAFGFPVSTYVGLFVITVLFSPANVILSPFMSAKSRKHEFEADAYASDITEHPGWMITALVKLSGHNLSNPKPHPLYVRMHYSHPPLLERTAALGADAELIRKTAAGEPADV